MTYESVREVESAVEPGVRFAVRRMSFARRMELMRQVRELARKVEYLDAGPGIADKMDAALLQAEIERLYVNWGIGSVQGLSIDGTDATPETLAEKGPEGLFREALGLVRRETGLSETERKN